MIVSATTPFGTYYLADPTVETSALLGTQLVGWFSEEGQMWPTDFGPVRLDTCESWEFLG
jgi:hypothetical protein